VNVANRTNRDSSGAEMSSRGRFATPADLPLHDCSPYRELDVRRESLGFVHRSRALFCHPVPNPNRPIHISLYAPALVSYGTRRDVEGRVVAQPSVRLSLTPCPVPTR
jgi:hypothetical protein